MFMNLARFRSIEFAGAIAMMALSIPLSGCGKVWVQLKMRSSVSSCLTATMYNAIGSGTSSDPYQICTAAQIQNLASSSSGWSDDFQLESNIDMTGVTISQPIGNSTTNFTGIFNGNNYAISNFTLNDATNANVGLFGVVSGNGTSSGIIENLTLTNANVTAGTGGEVGTLLGMLDSGLVSNCSATGTVTPYEYGGGLIGAAGATSASVWTITHSNANVTIVGNGFCQEVGGLIGWVNGASTSTITDCFALGDISNTFGLTGGLAGSVGGASVVNSFARGTITLGGTGDDGGLIGQLAGSIVENCYATGGVAASNGYIGGLIGLLGNLGLTQTIISSYATGAVSGGSNLGGLIGYDSGGTTYTGYSYWNNTVNPSLTGFGSGSSSNVVSASTSAMQTQTTYSSWNFTSGTGIWMMPTGGVNQSYPVLQWAGNQ